jgi:phosphoadenosine phosphosulfate reductase
VVTVLQFSGGKDSLACLYLSKQWWDEITVLWLNTGDAFPETIAQMDEIRAMVPHFVEAHGDQPRQIMRHGYPSDLVSVWDTTLGRACRPPRKHHVQDAIACCSSSIWVPLANATRMLGATIVIRGQRNSESRTSPLRSGDTQDGVKYLFPIQDWSERMVHGFLERNHVQLPPNYYENVNTSLDCQHCTAYLDDNQHKLEYVRVHHPALHKELARRLDYLIEAAEAELSYLKGARTWA